MNRRAFLTIFTLTPALVFSGCSLLPKKGADTAAGDVGAEKNTVHLRVDFDKQVRTVVIQLDPATAPETCANFSKLAKANFYNGLLIHRAIPNYLVQAGDPLTRRETARASWGTGGPGYTLPAETGGKHKRGAVAMARLGDDVNPDRESNGSQFYVCLTDIPSLDDSYTVFGTVTSGLEVFDAIGAAPADANDVPRRPVRIVGSALVDANAVVAKPQPSEAAGATKPATSTTTTDDGEPKGFFGRIVERYW